VCRKCITLLPYIEQPRCFRCGRGISDAEEEYCEDCLRITRHFDGGFPLFKYVPPVSDSVISIKYEGREDYIEFYAREIVRVHGDAFRNLGIEGLVPVPLSKKRYKKRGFNQALSLAEAVGALVGIPVLDIMERTIDTLPQKELGPEERMKNLEKAFAVKKDVSVPERLMVVDDIFTTGATVDTVAKLLKKAGATEVYYTSICR